MRLFVWEDQRRQELCHQNEIVALPRSRSTQKVAVTKNSSIVLGICKTTAAVRTGNCSCPFLAFQISRCTFGKRKRQGRWTILIGFDRKTGSGSYRCGKRASWQSNPQTVCQTRGLFGFPSGKRHFFSSNSPAFRHYCCSCILLYGHLVTKDSCDFNMDEVSVCKGAKFRFMHL